MKYLKNCLENIFLTEATKKHDFEHQRFKFLFSMQGKIPLYNAIKKILIRII